MEAAIHFLSRCLGYHRASAQLDGSEPALRAFLKCKTQDASPSAFHPFFELSAIEFFETTFPR